MTSSSLSYSAACAEIVAGKLAGRGEVKLVDLYARCPSWPHGRVHRALSSLREAGRVTYRFTGGKVVAVRLVESSSSAEPSSDDAAAEAPTLTLKQRQDVLEDHIRAGRMGTLREGYALTGWPSLDVFEALQALRRRRVVRLRPTGVADVAITLLDEGEAA